MAAKELEPHKRNIRSPSVDVRSDGPEAETSYCKETGLVRCSGSYIGGRIWDDSHQPTASVASA